MVYLATASAVPAMATAISRFSGKAAGRTHAVFPLDPFDTFAATHIPTAPVAATAAAAAPAAAALLRQESL